MEGEPEREYVMAEIMKKRRKDKQAVDNKIRNKIALKGKKGKKKDIIVQPDKFVSQYRAAQKSYAYLKRRNRQIANVPPSQKSSPHLYNKLLIVMRVRGVHDISNIQKSILSRLGLRQVNTAVFMKGTKAKLRLLQKVENYITYGEPSRKLIKELIYKKMYGKVNDERIHVNSNQLVEEHIGGEIICLEDVVEQICSMGEGFQSVLDFIFPFKLTTPPNTLASRLRKPIKDGGHWGYRGAEIEAYMMNMI